MRGGHYEVDTQEFRVPALVEHIADPRTQAEWSELTTLDPFGNNNLTHLTIQCYVRESDTPPPPD